MAHGGSWWHVIGERNLSEVATAWHRPAFLTSEVCGNATDVLTLALVWC